jgi:hypothetical protein
MNVRGSQATTLRPSIGGLDPGGCVAAGAVLLAVLAALVVGRSVVDSRPHSGDPRIDFQRRVGGFAPGPAVGGSLEEALLPGMGTPPGPADYMLLPGGPLQGHPGFPADSGLVAP